MRLTAQNLSLIVLVKLMLANMGYCQIVVNVPGTSSYRHETRTDVQNGFEVANGLHALNSSVISFNSISTGSNSFELSSRASVDVDIKQGAGDPSWSMTHACSTASAKFTDTATVEGVRDGTFGTVQLTFAVTGDTHLYLDTMGNNAVNVHDLSSLTTFTFNAGGEEDTLLQEFRTYANSNPKGVVPQQGGLAPPNAVGCPPTLHPPLESGSQRLMSLNEQFDREFGAASGALVLDVEWKAGDDIPIDFNLTTSVNLKLEANDASAVKAIADAHFFDTAKLLAADVYMGNERVPGAHLMGGNGAYPVTSVPEPHGFSLLSVAMLLGCLYRQRRFRA